MFVDMHHHVIYGVDDGPSTFEKAQAMLRKAHENDVSVIASTSHATPGIEPFPMDTYLQRLAEEQQWCDAQGLGIRLCPGSEIYYTKSAARLLQEGKLLPINRGDAVLVEFSPAEKYDPIREAVRRLGNAGYTVVVAHAERYDGLHDIDHIRDLREELGAYIQINAGTILSPGGFLRKRWVRRLMESEGCDLVGTDAHNTESRPCRMKACYQYIAETWGKQTADRLCIETPASLMGLD